MNRTNAQPSRNVSHFLIVSVFLVMGFCAVAVPAAYGSIASGKAPAPVARQSAALNEAEASCQMFRNAGHTSECHVMDWNPSLDIIVPISRPEAVEFCDQAAEFISARFKHLSGKTWKVRVFSSGLVPPTAVCRVR